MVAVRASRTRSLGISPTKPAPEPSLVERFEQGYVPASVIDGAALLVIDEVKPVPTAVWEDLDMPVDDMETRHQRDWWPRTVEMRRT